MSLRTMRQYATLPAPPTRGPISHNVWVVIPLDRTNLATNGSVELATTGYTAVGGSIARSAAQQYHGTYSLAVTPGAGTTDGAFFGTVALVASTPYAYSCKFKGQPGIPYKLSIATTGGADLSVTAFIATGRWQWIRGTVYGETSTTSRRVYITKNGSTNTGVFYVDGLQVEACSDGILDATTYIDGDQLGLLIGQQPPAYGWNGAPHASTSYRTILTRAGGYAVNLSTYNFVLTGLVGLGMAVPNNISIPYSTVDGARYQRTQKVQRSLTIPGRFQADDLFSLMQAQSDMRQAFDRDLVPLQQPLVLLVEPQDECGNVIGDFAQVRCIYAGGLEGNDGNVPVEDVAPTFTMYIPFLLGGDAGAAPSPQTSVSNANAVLQRSATGVWSALGTGITDAVAPIMRAAVYGLDNTLYVGGDFDTAGGTPMDNIAKWNGTSWSVVRSATALNNIVLALARGPDGRIYAGGDFINADGIANGDKIAVYDPVANTWAALSTGADGLVYALAFAPDGTLYAAGDFLNIGGVAANRVAKWNGSAWSALGTGLNNTGRALVVDKNGNLYAGGLFTTAGGTTVNYIAKWNGSAWSALAGGMSGGTPSVLTLGIGLDGRVYAGGNYTVAGGVTVNYIGVWNGTAWSPLGSGLNGSCVAMLVTPNGEIFAGGGFTVAGGITLPDQAAHWNGSTWLPFDADFPGSSQLNAFALRNDGNLVVGYGATGSAVVASNTTVTNTGPGIAYPKLTIYGPTSGTSRIYQIVNYTTGFGIFLNLTLSVGEIAVLDFDPQAPSFTTTFQGDITNTILPGSSLALFYLAPGANSISFFAASSTVTDTLSWQTRYGGVADLVN